MRKGRQGVLGLLLGDKLPQNLPENNIYYVHGFRRSEIWTKHYGDDLSLLWNVWTLTEKFQSLQVTQLLEATFILKPSSLTCLMADTLTRGLSMYTSLNFLTVLWLGSKRARGKCLACLWPISKVTVSLLGNHKSNPFQGEGTHTDPATQSEESVGHIRRRACGMGDIVPSLEYRAS